MTCTLCLLVINVYTAGMMNKVRISENMIPPTTTIPSGIRLVAAAPRLRAIGNAPKDVDNGRRFAGGYFGLRLRLVTMSFFLRSKLLFINHFYVMVYKPFTYHLHLVYGPS